jgi:hypothetical protein
MIAALEARGLQYILTAALRAPVGTLCRHDDAAWTPTEVPGIEVQDVPHDGVRLVVLRQRIVERPHAGGKQLLEKPVRKFKALRTNPHRAPSDPDRQAPRRESAAPRRSERTTGTREQNCEVSCG